MQIISFAWTTPAFRARRKGCTRRDWTDDYAARFKPGMVCQAWDKTPRCRGAKKIGTIRILSKTKEPYCDVPDSDWEAEGFAYLEEAGVMCNGSTPGDLFALWRLRPNTWICWVVRFEILTVEGEVTE